MTNFGTRMPQHSREDGALAAFQGGATKQDEWPAFEDNFYWDERLREWVYRWADERIIAAVRREDAE